MSAPLPSGYANKLYDPLFMYAQAVVSPGAGAGANTPALMNPHELPMEVLAVHWRLYPNNTSANTFARLTGMAIGVKMDLGDIPVVDANVPLNAFGTSRDDADLTSDNTAIFPDPNAPTVTANPYSYRWRLKYPLYIPPGCVLTPLYSHLGQNHFPVTVDTIFVCRVLPADYVPPAQVWAPWAGSYNSISFDNLASQPSGQDFSNELDIVNPFKQPLELARLTGRVSSVFSGTANVPVNFEDFTDHRAVLGKVRIRSRSGDEIARNLTPFNGLFPYTWRVWDIPGGWVMSPGEYYKVQLKVDATLATAPGSTQLGSCQYAVTGIGYRQLDRKVFTTAAMGGEA